MHRIDTRRFRFAITLARADLSVVQVAPLSGPLAGTGNAPPPGHLEGAHFVELTMIGAGGKLIR